jgi:anthranilate synthase/aminodeoxychorismate synthase-like glutamine amidotransferase
LKAEVCVRRNDELTAGEIGSLAPTHIVISPGPGRPEHAGITVDAIRCYGERVPILGVCLGHQAIGFAFGGRIVHAPALMHGKTSEVYHDDSTIFDGVPNPFVATRYHSLVIAPDDFPGELEATARTDDGVIMAVQHRRYPIVGVQFHPESILTSHGERMMRNWLEMRQ